MVRSFLTLRAEGGADERAASAFSCCFRLPAYQLLKDRIPYYKENVQSLDPAAKVRISLPFSSLAHSFVGRSGDSLHPRRPILSSFRSFPLFFPATCSDQDSRPCLA